MNLDEVRAFVDPDEPDYASAALVLGPEALPHLAELADGDDPMLASKAVYLAGLIGGGEARPILERASRHDDPIVRVALAATVENVDDEVALDIGRLLLDDPDAGVRRVTVTAAAQIESSAVRGRLQEMVARDDDEMIRSLAVELDD